ncbi:MAG: MauE/DoxX family redox-associated membrane protein [Pedobacter sp.]
MKTFKRTLTILFAAILIIAGINHFINFRIYSPFIPDWMPLLLTNILVGIVEVILGAGLLFEKYRKPAATGVVMLMIMFLPLHFIDVFKSHPAIGSITLAIIRLPVQFVLIYWAWYISKPGNQRS